MSCYTEEKLKNPSSSDIDVKYEREQYYYGLPSHPISVYRLGAPFRRPTGFEAYRVPKTIRPVFDDKFATIWEDMGKLIYKYLNSVAVKWTTIDVVRFAEPINYRKFEETVGPIVLWIGVIPRTLTYKLAKDVAHACKNILISFAFRESRFRRYNRMLLDHVPSADPISSFCGPLTAALGLPIASIQTPGTEGTGGIYLSAGNNIYLLTARHVVLPPEEEFNIVYNDIKGGQDTVQVMLPGPTAFNRMVQYIMSEIETLKTSRTRYKNQLNELQMEMANDAEEKRAMLKSDMMKETMINMLEDFQSNVMEDWRQGKDFIIGRVLYSPPISVSEGHNHNSEDWALIELDHTKINWPNFKGNVIDLEMTDDDFISLMYPHKFNLLHNRLFQIQGVVPEDELTRPKNKDKNGQPYIKLIKNGSRTKTTAGFGNGIKSFVREYLSGGTEQTSMEYAILVQENHSEFSDRGDSGSIIVDSEGRAAALLIGGCGYNQSTDITYATPFEWLLERIRTKFPNIHLYLTEEEVD
ncbi:hypothetical protein BDQ17DRAFT_1334507 [Cyathus striatus]|nr:hypothetical protein BDQ17DRAFT_1334507 [Cyathus striatus]